MIAIKAGINIQNMCPADVKDFCKYLTGEESEMKA
jgi:hypothetical protein